MTQDTGQRWKTSNKVQQGKNRQNHMFTRLPSSQARHGELTKEKNRQRGMFARHQLATNSPWRVTKRKKIGRGMGLLAMASEITWEASKGGLASPG